MQSYHLASNHAVVLFAVHFTRRGEPAKLSVGIFFAFERRSVNKEGLFSLVFVFCPTIFLVDVGNGFLISIRFAFALKKLCF